MTEPDQKTILRREARRHRALIRPEPEEGVSLSALFYQTLAPLPGQVIALYYPVRREMDALSLLEKAGEMGILCALPVLEPERRELRFARFDAKTVLQPGPYNIAEPVEKNWIEPDIVTVPLLAFDRKGYRLGQGGGHYDATLAGLRARREIVAVGLAYAQQAVLFNLPFEPHDQRLDLVITPASVHDYRKDSV